MEKRDWRLDSDRKNSSAEVGTFQNNFIRKIGSILRSIMGLIVGSVTLSGYKFYGLSFAIIFVLLLNTEDNF